MAKVLSRKQLAVIHRFRKVTHVKDEQQKLTIECMTAKNESGKQAQELRLEGD